MCLRTERERETFSGEWRVIILFFTYVFSWRGIFIDSCSVYTGSNKCRPFASIIRDAISGRSMLLSAWAYVWHWPYPPKDKNLSSDISGILHIVQLRSTVRGTFLMEDWITLVLMNCLCYYKILSLGLPALGHLYLWVCHRWHHEETDFPLGKNHGSLWIVLI